MNFRACKLMKRSVRCHDLGCNADVFNLHNRIKAGGGSLLVSGDAAPAQLQLRADLMTRLGSGLVYHVHGLNEEEKVDALRRHAQARGFKLSEEVVAYLLRHVQRDLP